ncbi:hypothetical protein NDU88_004688 [Pleurodeles waltl]|uniref:Uncharacterized protein n=1 Tax=Pleurodeles waltl TaxID=8319 RepID=A0AAV7QDP8_PLEWA|nr:hypothetical protein NDU88_004688 [Pleurodeles waltl]
MAPFTLRSTPRYSIFRTCREQAGALSRGERLRWVRCGVGSGAKGQKECGIAQRRQSSLQGGGGETASHAKLAPWFQQMRSPVELRCFGGTSRGRDDVTGPQALQWHWIITDV